MPETVPVPKEEATIAQITSVLDYLPLIKHAKTAQVIGDGAILAVGVLSIFAALNAARRARRKAV